MKNECCRSSRSLLRIALIIIAMYTNIDGVERARLRVLHELNVELQLKRKEFNESRQCGDLLPDGDELMMMIKL